MLRIDDIHGSAVIEYAQVQIHRSKGKNIFFIAPSQKKNTRMGVLFLVCHKVQACARLLFLQNGTRVL